MITQSRAKDGLRGLVKEVSARTVTISKKNGVVLEQFQSQRLWRYDEAGNKIEDANFKADGSLFFKIVYVYDLTGKLVERKFFDENQSLTDRTMYEYDRAGRLIEEKSIAADGSVLNSLRPIYNAKGGQIKEENLPVPKNN